MADRWLVVLWLTNRCNLNCSYCYADAGKGGQDMTFETAEKIMESLKGHALKIQFAGGEPMLNFSLVEQICQYAREKQIDAVFQMQTNGILLNDETVQAIRRYGVSVGVSLDGIPQINAKTRGESVRVVNGLRLLAEYGISVGINTVVTGENVKHLPELVDFAYYLGNVGGIGLDILRNAGRAVQNQEKLHITAAEIRKALLKMEQRRNELELLTGRTLEIREIALAQKRLQGKGRKDEYCYASCGRSVVVMPDGELYPCGSLREASYHMGNVETFEASRTIRLIPQTPPKCGGCSFAPYCPGGCPSRRIRGGEDLDCALLRTAFEIAEERMKN